MDERVSWLPQLRTLPAIGILIVGVGYFLAFGLSCIWSPGLYHDELLFLPGTLRLIYGSSIDTGAAVTASLGRVPIMLIPYIGALKANLYGPIIAILGTSAFSLRAPMLMVSAIALLMIFLFARPRIGMVPSLVLFVILATDPVFIYHSKIDWGPIVLANFFRILSISFLLRYIENGRGRDLALLLCAMALGFYDKINFIWTMNGVAAAAMIIYWRPLSAVMRQHWRKHILIVMPFFVLFFLMAVMLVLPVMGLVQTGTDTTGFSILRRFALIHNLYELTYSGSGQFGWMFSTSLKHKLILPYLLLPQMIFGTFVTIWSMVNNRDFDNKSLHYLASSHVLFLVIFLQMLFTRQVGGTHHLMALWPLQQVQLILCGVVIYNFLATRELKVLRHAFATASGALVLCFFLANVVVSLEYLRAVESEASFSPRFDTAKAHLAQVVSASEADYVISTDWGLHNPLLAQVEASVRPKLRDFWALFRERGSLFSGQDQWLYSTFFAGRRTIVITHAKAARIFPETWDNFAEQVSAWGLCLTSQQQVYNRKNQPLYEVLTFDDRPERLSPCIPI